MDGTKYKPTKKIDNPYRDVNSDFFESIGTVVIDEVHFMNDKDRGRVWEEILVLLDHDVQVIMLSATVKHPEKFASWFSKCHQKIVKN